MKYVFGVLFALAVVFTTISTINDSRLAKETAARTVTEKAATRKQFEKDIITAEQLTRPSCSEELVVVVWPPANLPEVKPRVVIAGYNVEEFNSMNVSFRKNSDGGFELRAQGGELNTKLPADSKFCRTEAEYRLKNPK